MKKYILYLGIPLLAAACGGAGRSDHDPATNGGHDHGEPEPLAYTLYTDSLELFVEFGPLVVGQESRFAAHFTHLRSRAVPVTSGSATVTLHGIGAPVSATADAPASTGIFRLALTPTQEGSAHLVFTLRSGDLLDTLTIDMLMVYADLHEAQHAEPQAAPAGDITYLKEQAWRIPFATERAGMAPFAPVLHVGAEVEPVPAGQETITARSAGVVHLMGDAPLEGMPVTPGKPLFTLGTAGVAEGNAAVALAQARHAQERARADLARTEALHADRLVTQDELLRARNALADATTLVDQLGGALTVSSSLSGHIRSLRVSEGQFVQAGTVLATVARNERLSIHADAPVQAYAALGTVTDARIKAQDGRVHTLKELNGRVVSVGRVADGPYVPVRLEVDGTATLVAGSVGEVWLVGAPSGEALTLPLSAIVEQEGRFFCYVQTAGETMDKRWLQLGGNDGLRVQVLGGLRAGERVVTTGAMDVKLATAGGAIPAHGHEH